MSVARGLAGLAAFALGAADALITARLGIPRLACLLCRAGRAIADEYRRGKNGAIDAEIIEENE